ncbi:MAG: glycosyltransferase family 4 protein [Bdellovibrionales bacterium]
MHLAFIDIASAYGADRPDEDAPLGGTTSAVCFLAREMVKAGIACTFFNKVGEPLAACGIRSLPLEALADECSNPVYSAFVFCGRWTEWLVRLVAGASRAPVVGWMHESLMGTEFVPALDTFRGMVFVSEWQKKVNQSFVAPSCQQIVIRNAMNPVFERLFAPDEPTLAAKGGDAPIIFYVGATPRGALHMPGVIAHLQHRLPDFSVEIYSSCAPSRDPVENAACFARMRALSHVTHVGMVGQAELAQRMKRASIMAMPNPWPETSCIALIEAMAAGLMVVATDRAALPETAAGFARHVPVEDADHPIRFDMEIPYEAFADAIALEWRERVRKPEERERRLRAQIDAVVANYQWRHRVALWTSFLAGLSG